MEEQNRLDMIRAYLEANEGQYTTEELRAELVKAGHDPAVVDQVQASRRTEAQQASKQLRQDAMANRPLVIVRVYQQQGNVGPEEAFAADAAVLATEGYRPTSQRWQDGKIGVGRAVALGVFALLAKPKGTLTVTYELTAQGA